MDSGVPMEMCFNVTIEEDMIAEDTTTMVFTLSVVNSNDLVGEFDTHTITQMDNDGEELWLRAIAKNSTNQ